jgi:hypothetical protein
MLGIAVIISSSLVINDFANKTGSKIGDKIVACSATALVAGFAQTISSAFVFFKVKYLYIYINRLTLINYFFVG